MKALGWILAGVGVGVITYVVLNQPGPQYATGNADIEDAADKASLWGSNQKLAGAGTSLFGKAKERVGAAIGDDELAGEGVGDQLVGAVKDTAGDAAHALGQTIHEINR